MRPRLTVRTPLQVLAIDRGENDQRALRAHLKYRYAIDLEGEIVETSTGASIDVPADLEDPLFLEKFLVLGRGKSDFEESL
jgi:hypothetical protein